MSSQRTSISEAFRMKYSVRKNSIYSTNFADIIQDTSQPQEFQFLTEKMILDFINGLSAASDLQNTIKKRSSHSNRIADAVSGKAHLRQAHLNDHMLAGLQACEGWLKCLSDNANTHAMAIERVSNSLGKTQQHLATLANVVLDVRQKVQLLSQHTQDLLGRFDTLQIGIEADRQLSNIFSSWKAGELRQYSALAKCYIVLDNLYWGNFAKVFSLSDKELFLKRLRNELIIQLKEELQAEHDEIILREVWIEHKMDKPKQELIEYMGDWSLKTSLAANAFLATQWVTLDEEEINRPEIYHLPFHIASIDTVVDNMTTEFFKVRING